MLYLYRTKQINKMENDIKNQLAILTVQEEELWKVCDKAEWPKSLRDIHNSHCNKLSVFKLEHFPKRVTITGCETTDGVSHYEIDDGLTANFSKDEVTPDSEGGMFCCYTDVNNRDKIVKYLKDNWTTLKFETEKEHEGKSPFINWHAARKYAEENNLEVPVIIESTILDTLQEFDDKIEAATTAKQEYINSLKC